MKALIVLLSMAALFYTAYSAAAEEEGVSEEYPRTGTFSNGCGYCMPNAGQTFLQQPDSDCTRYDWITKWATYDMSCPAGTKFDFEACTCNHAYLVDCGCGDNRDEDAGK